MNYEEARAYLDSRVSYEKRGMPESTELRLDRMVTLLEAIGSPHADFPIIHVAGTKGKGTTSTMIASMLTGTGRKVALHTSPHFERVEERAVISGEPIPGDRFTRLVEEIASVVEEIDAKLAPDQPGLTFFEITIALAMLYFSREQVDAAVVEVGMGGRLDSTNVVIPVVSVITSISFDHTNRLGNTLAAIAREKAGIIKTGRPVVSGVVKEEPASVIREVCRHLHAPLREAGPDFVDQYHSKGLAGGRVEVSTWRRSWPPLDVALPGRHQGANIALAAATCDTLEELGWTLPTEQLKQGLRLCRVPGRIETIRRHPLVITDVAHNEASASALVAAIPSRPEIPPSSPSPPRVLIFGSSVDKDWRAMLAILLPHFSHAILARYVAHGRAVEPSTMVEDASRAGIPVLTAETPARAWEEALRLAGTTEEPQEPASSDLDVAPLPDEPMICITGSFFLVAEMRTMMPLAEASVRPISS
ncbi:Folylpolyglutamate synthase [Planctomycetes bacterium Pan216]|uniref:Dihydrofolate synthase/folylpolyglutamate synthase n=1 Tax=Kolteria novifilia TaxID=2527975 RepID=A0A518B4H9_9BACT|nr:Folylpolyglutamate synthase [Planctomycetes bacterium Pan216]